MKFVKMHGTGNDFILVNCLKKPVKNPAALARRVCHRYSGIGANGLILILSSPRADFRMRMFNPDGSEAEMCGNGIRCLGKFVSDKGLTKKNRLIVATRAGLIPLHLSKKNGKVQQVTARLGRPKLLGQKKLRIKNKLFTVCVISMGNPHCVIRVKNVAKFPVKTYGPLIERHRYFPRRTNVEFIEISNRKNIKQRTWERGAGETLACGTGASAAVVAGIVAGQLDRQVKVTLAGGTVIIKWTSDNEVYLSGPAVEVFSGEF
ncbi:MAG: diaminopimelate epimerase [Planctomycetes bacterium]|nr:diaminopimelate epimerase [Planctomycetota bacterium]